MARLSKAQAKAHQEACALLANDRMTFDEKWQVYETWQESATHVNNLAGAFFTPIMLARDFSIEVPKEGCRIIDLCAGIGALSFMAYHHGTWGEKPNEIVCVEKNPDYVAAGRKLLPEATWIEADIFDLPADLGRFDVAIANPPFGRLKRAGRGPRYSGSSFEYHVIDIAADLARYGVFIVPAESAPFRYSGQQHYEERQTDGYRRFAEQTGLSLGANCGIDCSVYANEWHGVAPKVEIVTCDFERWSVKRAEAAHGPLFAQGAA